MIQMTRYRCYSVGLPRVKSPKLTTRFREEPKKYQGSSTNCPHCLDAAKFQDLDRPKAFLTLLGWIRLEQRPYSLCSHCHHGFFPGDIAVNLQETRLSTAAEQIVTLAGGAIAPVPRISAEFERSGPGTCPEFLSRGLGTWSRREWH